MFDRVAAIIGLLLAGALIGLVLVATLDPACGPTGDEQNECMTEFMTDLMGGK